MISKRFLLILFVVTFISSFITLIVIRFKNKKIIKVSVITTVSLWISLFITAFVYVSTTNDGEMVISHGSLYDLL